MPTETDDGTVRITLKDVYESNQVLTARVADAFSELKLTLAGISSHLQSVDQRNQAADEIHRDHSSRIRKLEDAQVSEDTVSQASKAGEQARVQVRWALVGALLAALGVAAQYAGLIPHH